MPRTMLLHHRWPVSVSFRRYASIDYLLSAVPKRSPAPPPVALLAPQPQKAAVPNHKLTYNPVDLTHHFWNANYTMPLAGQMGQTNALFYNAKIQHEWTCAAYGDIPDIKVARLLLERQTKLDSVTPYSRTEYHANLAQSRTLFGVDPQLLAPLPEVLFLGHTNAGKSTLINNLFLNKYQTTTANDTTEYAFVSRQAGYTKCLNCFNVGGKLRLVDSPGYGQFGEDKQGKVVLDYIQQRKQLRRTFLVIDSTQGVREEDATLMDFLTEHGVPFEIVLTKVDEVAKRVFPRKLSSAHELAKEGNSKLVEHFQRLIERGGLAELPTLPRLLFNNSRANKVLQKRSGFREIRYAIAESCGLAP